MIAIEVNGERREIADGTTLESLLDDMDANRSGIAAALNGDVVTRAQWPRTVLPPEARVDVLTAVQGG